MGLQPEDKIHNKLKQLYKNNYLSEETMENFELEVGLQNSK